MTADLSKLIMAKDIKSLTIKLKGEKTKTITDILYTDKKGDYCFIYCNLDPVITVRLSDVIDVKENF